MMDRAFLCILALLTLGVSDLQAEGSEAETLVKQLKKIAAPGAGITEDEQDVAKKLGDIGAPAIPLLIPLLQNENKEIRALAAYALSEMQGLTDEHLDALIKSARRGDSWISRAIANVGTPKAIRFLFEELARKREERTTLAIAMLGEKAVPGLLALYQSEKNWDDRLEGATRQILRELGDRAVPALEPLMKMAREESVPEPQRIRALNAIGAIGRAAEPAVPMLLALNSHPSSRIKEASTKALLSTGAREGAHILAERLPAADFFGRTLILRDIAEMKERGVAAGPAVIKYLDDPDFTVRVCAASTLGYIGYTACADALIPLLKNENDWRLVLVVAQSLGRLQIERAVPALDTVGRDHWFPPVRAAAIQAAVAVRTAIPVGGGESDGHFPFEYFAFEHAGQDLETISYDEENSIRYPSPPIPEQILDIPIRQKNGRMRNQKRSGLKVASGYLTSEDRGEWGGAINFVDLKGKVTAIKEVNTHAIYRTPRGIVALTGLAHLTMNSGMLMQLTAQPDGRWVATDWRALPGAPNFSRILEDGRILVSCDGGLVLISPEGAMMMATRHDLGLTKDAQAQ